VIQNALLGLTLGPGIPLFLELYLTHETHPLQVSIAQSLQLLLSCSCLGECCCSSGLYGWLLGSILCGDTLYLHFTFRIRTAVVNFSIFNIQVLNCETSRPQTFCRIFCNLKTLQPASYLYIISSCETPPEVYPQLYMFSLLTMGCCHLTLHVAARVESHLRAKLEISGIHKILSIIKENLI
jgi:hypothetical protein